jgi:hypothetical protein
MKLFIAAITLIFTTLSTIQISAQTAPAKFVKYTPPKLFTSLGVVKDSSKAPVAQAKAILGQRLTIQDEKGKKTYAIQSYQFLYRKRVVTEDEAGNPQPATSLLAKQFYNGDSLPAAWVATMREEMLAGEELYFFDIIVKDDKGRIMYAPTLKIFVVN